MNRSWGIRISPAISAISSAKCLSRWLMSHHANQTYAYQLQSYNLMNFLEFVSDHYATAYIDHYFNGFFFNKIPLLKKLKWREVIEAKVLYGGLRNENNPGTRIPSR
jgi:hypothetical protein